MKRSAEPFDESYYLQTYPDVAQAVRTGSIRDGLTHYERHGREEGRLGHAAQEAAVALFFAAADEAARATLEALRAHRIARLFLIPLQERAAGERVVMWIDWPAELELLMPAGDTVIARRLSSLQQAFERVDALILLDAGMLVDADFFLFCNVMLERCLANQKIVQVTGSCCAPSAEGTGRPWLSSHGETWGMALWSRAFKRLLPLLEKAKPETGRDWGGLFWQKRDPELWANRWHAAVTQSGGLVVAPPVNLVTHAGVVHPVAGRQRRGSLGGLIAPLPSDQRDVWLDGETFLHRFVLETWRPLPLSTEIVDSTPVDVVICHNEISDRHGVGALLGRLLRGRARWRSYRTETHFERPEHLDEIELGDVAGEARFQAYGEMNRELAGHRVGQILCVPYREVEAWRGVAAAVMTGRPLIVYLMDDQNIHAAGISDEAMEALLRVAARRYAICEEMREAYCAKFGHSIEALYPAVDCPMEVCELEAPRSQPGKGVLTGNLWTPEWVRRFAAVMKDAGVEVDWFGNAGGDFRAVADEELAAAGVTLRGFLPQLELASTLRGYEYGVVPTATRAESGSHGWMAALSFPSKIMTMVFEGGLPLLVLAEGANPAVHFVERTGLGMVVDYDAAEVRRVVALLRDSVWRAEFRERLIRWRDEFSLACARRRIWGET